MLFAKNQIETNAVFGTSGNMEAKHTPMLSNVNTYASKILKILGEVLTEAANYVLSAT